MKTRFIVFALLSAFFPTLLTAQNNADVSGTTVVDTLSIRGSGSIFRPGLSSMTIKSPLNLAIEAGHNDGVFFRGDDYVNLMKVDFNTDGVAIGNNLFTPLEKLHVDGAIKMGSTASNNEGTIQYDGTDFLGYDGTDWKSLTTTSSIVDGDDDSSIYFEEGNINKDYINFNVAGENRASISGVSGNNSSTLSLFSPGPVAAGNNIYFEFRYGSGYPVGSLNFNGASKVLRMSSPEYNIQLNAVYNGAQPISAQSTIGVIGGDPCMMVYERGGSSATPRALFDVRGSAAADEVKISDLMEITPSSTVPTSPSTGTIYMDNGANTGGTPTLRYYNGSTWINLN